MHSIAQFQRSHSYQSESRNISERNLCASLCHTITLVLLFISIAEVRWFNANGQHCPKHLSVNQFFDFGYFDAHNEFSQENQKSVRVLDYHSNAGVIKCVTPHIVNLMHVTIAFCFFAIISTLWAFFMDLLGTTNKAMGFIRRNAIPSVITVLCVVVIIGLCYYITTLLEKEIQNENTSVRVFVTYDLGYFTIAGAGAASILGMTCNLFRCHRNYRDLPFRHLVEEWDGLESFVIASRDRSALIPSEVPPPPYTP